MTHDQSLELHLSRNAFATGQHLSGVVVFRLAKPAHLRSLTVGVRGSEAPAGAGLTRAIRGGNGSFFDRDVLLTGSEEPRTTADRASRFWNEFLARDPGRTLSRGEHTYPFTIPLPASLPPSYQGKAGTIIYRVTASAHFVLGRVLQVSTAVPVVFVPRTQRSRPVALSYPTAGGSVHATEISVQIELPQKTVALGGSVRGRCVISNPQALDIPEIKVSLESCEWVKLTDQKAMHRSPVDSRSITPEERQAESIEAEFDLSVPETAAPTVEGTAISVMWLLKLSVGSTPPLELKTPITVYAPMEGDSEEPETEDGAPE